MQYGGGMNDFITGGRPMAPRPGGGPGMPSVLTTTDGMAFNMPWPGMKRAAAQAAGAPTIVPRPGDWYCPSCRDLQFARNPKCRRCETPNPDPGASLAAMPASSAPVAQVAPGSLMPGDWVCTQCGDHVFARNPQCRRCGTAKPPGAGAPNIRVGQGGTIRMGEDTSAETPESKLRKRVEWLNTRGPFGGRLAFERIAPILLALGIRKAMELLKTLEQAAAEEYIPDPTAYMVSMAQQEQQAGASGADIPGMTHGLRALRDPPAGSPGAGTSATPTLDALLRSHAEAGGHGRARSRSPRPSRWS